MLGNGVLGLKDRLRQDSKDACFVPKEGVGGWRAAAGQASPVQPRWAGWSRTGEPGPWCADRARLHVPGSGLSGLIFLLIPWSHGVASDGGCENGESWDPSI